jgi:hypothetical protein
MGKSVNIFKNKFRHIEAGSQDPWGLDPWEISILANREL